MAQYYAVRSKRMENIVITSWPFCGDRSGFPLRKEIAERVAVGLSSDSVEIIKVEEIK
jgi:hypothetical protein